MLLSIARGAEKNTKVLIILPTEEKANLYKKIYGAGSADILSYKAAIIDERAKLKYSIILLDGCERMPANDIDPVDIVCRMYDTCTKPIMVIGA